MGEQFYYQSKGVIIQIRNGTRFPKYDVFRGRRILRNKFPKTRLSGNDEICGDYSVSTLIVKDLSRLGREYSYMGRLQDFIFPAYDVRFIAINDDVDSGNAKSGDDILGSS